MTGKTQFNHKPPSLLMAFVSDPWSEWTMSGISRHICLELLGRGALQGALDVARLRLSRGPDARVLGRLRRLRDKVSDRLGAPQGPLWSSEEDPRANRLLRQQPPDTNLVYAFHSPEVDSSLSLRRFRLMDMSLVDAFRFKSYGFSEIPDKAFDAMYQNQYRTIHAAKAILTLSSQAADAIARDFHVDRAKVYPIGGGAAVAFDAPPVTEPARYAKGEILFVGRDWQRKGGPMLLEAFASVRRALPHAVLTIVGPSANPAPGQAGINFVGFLAKDDPADAKRLRDLFLRASAFCMPSICETWGLVYCEAQRAGAPIVGFQDWALPDMVVNGRSGVLVSDRSAEALAEGLIAMLKDPELAASCAREAQQYMTATLQWSNVVDRMLYAVAEDKSGLPEPAWLAGDRARYRGA